MWREKDVMIVLEELDREELDTVVVSVIAQEILLHTMLTDMKV